MQFFSFSQFYNILYLALHIVSGNSFPKPLSAKDERECLIQIELGDIEARNRLIEHNLRLVAHIIKKYYYAARDQDDLISIGTIGLIKAASTYNYKKGTRFATYASRCIENEILMYFRNRKKTAMEVFIDDPIDSDKEGNSITLMDIVSDDTNLVDNIDLTIKSEKMYGYIHKCLDEREQLIIYLRYGLGGHRTLTQREIAKKLDISRSYVSRIEKKAIQDLRVLLKDEL